jgi:hypothetical protein
VRKGNAGNVIHLFNGALMNASERRLPRKAASRAALARSETRLRTVRQQIYVAHNVQGVALSILQETCATVANRIFINHLKNMHLLACGVQFLPCLLVGAQDWSAS